MSRRIRERAAARCSDSVTIWSGTTPITRTGPLERAGARSRSRRRAPRGPCASPTPAPPAAGSRRRGAPALQHELGHERLEVGEEQQVGLVAGRDRAEVAQPVPGGAGFSVAITSASSGATPSATASRTIELTCPSSAMCSGSRSSVQNAIRCGPYSADERDQVAQVARARRLADQQPHPGAQPLAALLDRVRLVVGADPGGRVRVERLAEHARRVAVDVRRAVEPSFASSCGSPPMTPGKFIISASPSTRRRRSSASRSPRRERPPRRLEHRRRHRRRGHEVDVEREPVGRRRGASARRRCRARSRSRAGRRRPRSCPSGSTSRANSSTSSFDDSRWRCESTKPGTTQRPAASTISLPS